MTGQWFYLQQWKRRRWENVGVELSQNDAKHLFKSLTIEIEDYSKPIPIALVTKENKYKVIQKMEDGWNIVACNVVFLNNGKDEPLSVQRVGNEKNNTW